MEFRIATTADLESVRQIWTYAFNGDEPFASWYFTNYYNPENALGCWQDNRLLAILHMHPYQLYLRGQVVAASYIVGVATDPTARRGGITGPLLAAALSEMRQRRRPVSILMPFKAGFYYPYEWRLCHHQLKYSLQLEDLRAAAKPAGAFRPVGLTDIEALDTVYRCFVSERHGYIVRSAIDWRHLLGEHTNDAGHAYLLEIEGQPMGYVLYSLHNGKIQVREIAYNTVQAQQAVLDFLYNHRSHAQSVEWNAPLDTEDKVLFTLFEAKQDIRVFPFMTGRLADVEQTLNTIVYPAGQWGVDLSVCDSLAPWNNRTFQLRVNNRKAVTEATTAVSNVKLSVGALTQLVFGRLTAQQLVLQGELSGELAAIETLAALFPQCDNYINEYF